MITTIVLGPRPEALVATTLVDSFDYLNWIDHFSTGRVNLRLLKEKPEKFDRLNDSGLLWSAHTFLSSSVWVVVPVSILAIYFYRLGNLVPYYFLAGWILHSFTDILTHKNGFYPLYPLRIIKLRMSILNYHHTNLIKSAGADILLFLIMLARLLYFK